MLQLLQCVQPSLQCYLFAAVAAHHEAAELAPGARSEEHEADGAAAH